MHIHRIGTPEIDRAMKTAERIALGIAYVIVGLAIAVAAALFGLSQFTSIVRF